MAKKITKKVADQPNRPIKTIPKTKQDSYLEGIMARQEEPSRSLHTSYTLIIWEEIPENTRLILVPNEQITEERLGYLIQSNGCYINGDGWDKNKGLAGLYDWLCEEDGTFRYPELESKIVKNQLVFDNVIITRVCHTGFIL